MKYLIPALLLAGLILGSCESRSGQGIVAGGVVGTNDGFAGNGSGVVFGTYAGSYPGGYIGSALDEQDRNIMMQSSARTVERMDKREPLTVSDIIKLHEGGVSDDTIVRYVQNTRTTYDLSQSQIKRLQEAGVSQRLINFLVETGR